MLIPSRRLAVLRNERVCKTAQRINDLTSSSTDLNSVRLLQYERT